MDNSLGTIEAFRKKNDAALMAIPGVVSVATGIGKDGKPCLLIGTSRPVDEVRELLPEIAQEIAIELEFWGDIQAQ